MLTLHGNIEKKRFEKITFQMLFNKVLKGASATFFLFFFFICRLFDVFLNICFNGGGWSEKKPSIDRTSWSSSTGKKSLHYYLRLSNQNTPPKKKMSMKTVFVYVRPFKLVKTLLEITNSCDEYMWNQRNWCGPNMRGNEYLFICNIT